MEFTLKDVKIKVGFSFLAVLCLASVSGRGMAILYAFSGILIHECGHLAAILLFGEKISAVSLNAVGIKIHTARARLLSYARDVIILLAGSFFSLLAGAFFLLIGNGQASGMNFVLGAFNLLPFACLDGGGVVLLIAESFGKSTEKTALCMKYINAAVLICVIIFCVLNRIFNVSLTVTVAYLFAVNLFSPINN